MLHIRQYIGIGVGDEEPVREHMDDGSNEEVSGSVELGSIRRTAGLGCPCALQELSSDAAGVPNWRFVDGDHVIRQTVGDDELTALVLRLGRVLQRNKEQS